MRINRYQITDKFTYILEYSEFHLKTIVKVGANFGISNFDVHPNEITNGLGIESKFKPEFGLPNIGVTYKSNYLHTGSGPILEAEVIEKIAKLRAELTFDIYQVDQELSDEELNSDKRRFAKKKRSMENLN